MKPVLAVTGAAGFLGRTTRARLASEYRLLSTDVCKLDPVANDEILHQADLENPEDVERFCDLLRAHRPAALVHYAAYYDFSNRPNQRYLALQNALDRLTVCFHQDFSTDAVFILASSMAALAPVTPGDRLTETSKRLAGWEYPKSKIKAEKTLDDADCGKRCTHRLVQLVFAGVYSDWAELVPLYQAIERVRSRSVEKYFIPADPGRGLTYVHIEDAVTAVAAALHRAPQGKSRYLVGEAAPVSYQTIHQIAAQGLLGRALPLWRVPKWFALVGAYLLSGIARLRGQRRFVQPWMIRFAAEHFEFDLSKIRRDLDWEPKHRLEEELPKLVDRARRSVATWQTRNEARPW